MTLGEKRAGIRRFVGDSSILLVVLLFGCFAWAQTDHAPKEGDRAPNFSITDGLCSLREGTAVP